MSNSLDALIRDLRTFEGKKVMVKELRKEIRRPVPKVRKAIKARALATMPRRGGLNRWVAAIRITARIKLSGRAAGVSLKGGRNSLGARSDMRRIDKGRVRAPSWGRRTRGNWHNTDVPAGFFTEPAADTDAWRDATIKAVDSALEVIRHG